MMASSLNSFDMRCVVVITPPIKKGLSALHAVAVVVDISVHRKIHDDLTIASLFDIICAYLSLISRHNKLA